MPLYLAEKEGLIEVFHDKLLNVYSFIVKASGEVVSFFLAFPESDWPDWLKDHMGKQKALHGKLPVRGCSDC